MKCCSSFEFAPQTHTHTQKKLTAPITDHISGTVYSDWWKSRWLVLWFVVGAP